MIVYGQWSRNFTQPRCFTCHGPCLLTKWHVYDRSGLEVSGAFGIGEGGEVRLPQEFKYRILCKKIIVMALLFSHKFDDIVMSINPLRI